MLFSPEAHEALLGRRRGAPRRARRAIAAIVADAEAAFDDGWSMHPADVEEGDDPATRFRTLYLGGAGVVAALHRLERQGLRRAAARLSSRISSGRSKRVRTFPDDDAERSLWMGETGIRLVLQRLAPSAGEPRAAGGADRGERARRALRADVGQPGDDPRRAASSGWTCSASVRRGCGVDGTRTASGRSTSTDGSARYLGPAHGFAGCALALGEAAEVSRDAGAASRSRRTGSSTGRRYAGMSGSTDTGDGLIRTQWCHGAPGIVDLRSRRTWTRSSRSPAPS